MHHSSDCQMAVATSGGGNIREYCTYQYTRNYIIYIDICSMYKLEYTQKYFRYIYTYNSAGHIQFPGFLLDLITVT